MARPRKTTLDEWLEKFASWSQADREGALEQAADAHKWISKTEDRIAKGPEPLPLLEGAKNAD